MGWLRARRFVRHGREINAPPINRRRRRRRQLRRCTHAGLSQYIWTISFSLLPSSIFNVGRRWIQRLLFVRNFLVRNNIQRYRSVFKLAVGFDIPRIRVVRIVLNRLIFLLTQHLYTPLNTVNFHFSSPVNTHTGVTFENAFRRRRRSRYCVSSLLAITFYRNSRACIYV